MREREYSKVGILGNVIGLAGLALGDFVTNRPNRLASGKGLSVFEILDFQQWMLFAAGFFCLGFISLFPGRRSTIAGILLTPLMILALLWAQGTAASSLVESGGSFARVSMGSSLWIALRGLFIIFTDMLQRLGKDTWCRLLSAGIFVIGQSVQKFRGQGAKKSKP